MRRSAAWAAVLLAVAGAARAGAQDPAPPAAAASAPPVVPAATLAEMQAVQELVARAMAEFEGAQQSRSIVILDEIVSRLEVLRLQGTLTPRGRDMLAQAYEMRGRAYFNIGLTEKASDSFRSLVQLQPQHTMSRERVSPKVVDHFSAVKKALVGYLAVSSKPPGARVTLSGEFLGLTDFFPVEVLAGDYTIEVSREGYRTETRPLSIAPRATETVDALLTRTAASAFFVTEPSGVEIWVDGELRATTGGTLSPELAEAARARGVEPARASARTEVANLGLGSHVVELRRKCHEPVRRTLEISAALDYEVDPVRLAESLAALQLRSDPPGGKIFIDGEPMGVTPRDLEGLCSGRHRIEVKHASGRFVQDVVLEKDESLTLDSPIRPTLAFLGVVTSTAAGQRLAAEVEERLLVNVAKITTLNVVPASADAVDRVLATEKVTRASLLAGAGTDPDVVRRVTERLAALLEVQGFLIASLPDEKLQRTAALHLLAAGNAVPDQFDVSFRETASYQRFLAAVDRQAPLYRPWAGLITVDTLMQEGAPVLRIVPGGPAAKAGVQVGDVVLATDGKPLRSTADLLAAIESRRPGDKLTLHLRGAAGERTAAMTLDKTPQEIPLNDAGLLYNKVMMDLRQQVEGYPGTEQAAFARLNLALAAMHFADFAAAHEHLIKARTELPARPGISQGTALYYLGLALDRLGYRKEAADSYRAAAGFKDATLFNNDGPAVAPLAARRAGS